jgi:hypothetical protein
LKTKEQERLSLPELLAGPVIVTRYLGPTNCRGSRVVATHRRESSQSGCHPWRAVISWDQGLSSEANHQAAAEQLLANWPHETALRIVGRGHDDDAYYWLTAIVRQDESGATVIAHV